MRLVIHNHVSRRRTRDAIHPDYSKVKHLAPVQAARREYVEAYKNIGTYEAGQVIKAAENKLNAAVEKALSPRDV